MSSDNKEVPFKVKMIAPVNIIAVSFAGENEERANTKLFAVHPASGKIYEMVSNLDALREVKPEEIKAMEAWQEDIRQKAILMGGNIAIGPDGEVHSVSRPGQPSKLILG